MRQLFEVLLPVAALMASSPVSASAQTPAVICTPAADMVPAQLHGLWQLVLWPQTDGNRAVPASSGTVLFELHPEFPGSVRGSLRRTSSGNDAEALVSGDVTLGAFNLDESADGMTMDAVWEGEVTPSGCAQQLRGIRRPAQSRPSDEPVMNFVLQKAPGWR